MGAEDKDRMGRDAVDEAEEAKKEREEPDGVHNIYDTAFRTIIEFEGRLIIAVINEIFGTSHPLNAHVRKLKNDHVAKGATIITDLYVEIEGMTYHVEVQSVTDGKMIIRIVQYATAIAMESAVEEEDGSWRMKFPNSCAIYVRSTRNTPDKLTIHMDYPNGETVTFDAPLMKVKDYSKDDIFNKELLLILPYYLVRFENDCKAAGKMDDQEEADRKMDNFLSEYKDICDRLLEVCDGEEERMQSDDDEPEERHEKGFLYTLVAEQIKQIAEHLAPENQKERVKEMGGTVMKPQAQILVEQGEEKGEMKTLAGLVKKGLLTLQQAADERSLTVDDFKKQCKLYNLSL